MFKIKDKVQIDGDIRIRSTMFKVGDIVRVNNKHEEREILSIYQATDGRIFCGLGGFLRHFEASELHLIRPSTIHHPYTLGQHVYYRRGQSIEDECIIIGIERASGYDNVPHLRYNIYYPWTDTVVHMVRREKLRPLESYTLF